MGKRLHFGTILLNLAFDTVTRFRDSSINELLGVECCTISQNIHWPGLEISETARVKLEFFIV